VTGEWVPPLCEAQPVAHVRWVPRELLDANDYNPNRVAPPELALLETSLIEDGWTQPLVVRPEGDRFEIVDGFHRWTVSGRPKVYDLTDGMVPVVELAPADGSHQRMSTIRHNRARGTHHVVAMADIVAQLVDSGMGEDEIARRLSMENEEVRRLLARGNMLERGRAAELGQAWKPAPK
jgi:ParB-like chromosome segregation protein Spo0J